MIRQLVVGIDQIGVYILPSNGCTFHDRGADQVDIVAKDEKRAYTAMVASTPTGEFLPWHQVWAGASAKSTPSNGAPRMTEALERGFDFTFAKSKKKTSHFSTFKTMKEVSLFSLHRKALPNQFNSGLRMFIYHIKQVSSSQTQILVTTSGALCISIAIRYTLVKNFAIMSL